MRSVWLSVVLAVVAAGGAQAAPRCVIVADDGIRYAGQEVVTPGLVGEVFRVGRYVERPRMIFSKPRGAMFNGGYEAYELAGKAGKFVIRHDHNDGTPAIEVVSLEGGDPRIRWAGARGAPSFDDGGDYVIGGPLTSLLLKPTKCP